LFSALAGASVLGEQPHNDSPVIITLNEAISRALTRNAFILQKQQLVENARYKLVQAGLRTPQMIVASNASAASSAGLDPQSDITGTNYASQGYSVGVDMPFASGLDMGLQLADALNNTNSQIVGAGTSGYTFGNTAAGVTVSYPLGLFRDERVLREGARKEAELTLQRAELELESMRENAVATTLQDYFDAVRAQWQEQIVLATQADADELLRIAREKFKLGKIPEIDVLEAQVEANTALASVRNQQSMTASALDQLKSYLDIPFDTPLQLSEAPSITIVQPATDESQLTNAALENRADLRQLALDVRSAQLAVQQAAAQGRPKVALTAGYGLTGEGTSLLNGFNQLVSPNWNIGLVTTMGLSNRENQSNTNQAKSLLRLAEIEEQAQQNAIALEIRRRLREIHDAQANATLFADNVTRAEENVHICQVQLAHGLVRPIDVMQIVHQLAETRQRHVDAVIDLQLAQAQLDLAIGTMPVVLPQSREPISNSSATKP
jgi:outer membrane protein TolC